MATYEELVLLTQEICKEIENSPSERGLIREKFYKQYGFKEQDGRSYGRSEIAFYDYEEQRGVMNPIDDAEPGSHWWRNVNLQFIYFSELAGAMFAEGIVEASAPNPVKKWLDYLNNPTPTSWYRAHNSSIFTAAEQYRDDATLENNIERFFLNPVLYRLMFAQALLENPDKYLTLLSAIETKVTDEISKHLKGLFKKLADKSVDNIEDGVDDIIDVFADPRGVGVIIMVHIYSFYPTIYPLKRKDLALISGDVSEVNIIPPKTYLERVIETEMVKIMDNKIILPNLKLLYEDVAIWNDVPFVAEWQSNGEPVYSI